MVDSWNKLKDLSSTGLADLSALGNIFGVNGIVMFLVLGSIFATVYVVAIEFLLNKKSFKFY